MPTQFVVVVVFILYFVNAIQLKAKQKISRTQSGEKKKKIQTIDKCGRREKEGKKGKVCREQK